jgi:hypothetical protein
MNTISPQVTATGTTENREKARAASLWLGYAPTGGRVSVRHDELKGKLLVAGHAADDVASLLAYACQEVGLKVLILDTDGHITERVSGYFETYDYTCFLYDAFQLEEEDGPRHSQLIAAAYTAAMDLSSEEEAIMNAAMQKLTMQDTRASPVVLFDALEGVEGFRGFYIDKLKGRIGALKFLESAENGSFRSLLSLGSSIVSFRSAQYPQAMEVAAAAFVAKLLTMLPSARSKPDLVIMNDVHRLFRANPRPQHVNRLLGELLDASITVVLVSDQSHALSQALQDGFPSKILSSDAWNEGAEGRWKGNSREPILPNACVIADGHFGHQRTFIPRLFEVKTSEPRKGPGVVEQMPADDKLTALILDDVRQFDASTRASLIEFLSGDYGAESVKHELDRLESQGHIKLESKPVRSGDPMLVYTLTASGQRLLEMLHN